MSTVLEKQLYEVCLLRRQIKGPDQLMSTVLKKQLYEVCLLRRQIKGPDQLMSTVLKKQLYEVCLLRIKEQFGKNRGTVGTYQLLIKAMDMDIYIKPFAIYIAMF